MKRIILAALLTAGFVVNDARGKTFTVTSAEDSTNSTTLRGAVMAANALGGANTIILTVSSFKLSVSDPTDVVSMGGDLNVTTGHLAILGLNGGTTILGGTNFYDRLIHIHTNAQLTLSNITMTGGQASGGYSGRFRIPESGGAILNEGSLRMENCAVSNNVASQGNFGPGIGGGDYPGDGGGIYNSGNLSMVNCQIVGNSSGVGYFGDPGGNGGGLYNASWCNISRCAFIANVCGAGTTHGLFGFAAPGGSGGAIFNRGLMTLEECVVENNKAGQGGSSGQQDSFGTIAPPGWWGAGGGNGGGIFSSGELKVTRCVIVANLSGHGGNGYRGSPGGAGGSGGKGAGIYSEGKLSILGATISENVSGAGGAGGPGDGDYTYPADGGTGGPGGKGGGVFSSGELSIVASTVIRNEGGAGGQGGDGAAGHSFWIGPDGPVFPTNYVGRGGIGGGGGAGGVATDLSTTNKVMLRSTLIALNAGGHGGESGLTQASNAVVNVTIPRVDGKADVDGNLASTGHNLIGKIDSSIGLVRGDIFGSPSAPLDPLIAISRESGASSYIPNLLPASPAIDAGADSVLNAPFSLAVDARGAVRKFGGRVDIGAVEFNAVVDGAVLSPFLKSAKVSETLFKVSFIAPTSLKYDIFTSENLVDWRPIGSSVEEAPGLYIFESTRQLGNKFFIAKSR